MQQSAFGDIWTRPGLPVRDRSMITVAVLAALGQTEELRSHLAGALNVGISREEIVEILMHISIYAGVPAAGSALRVAADVLGTDGTRGAGVGYVCAHFWVEKYPDIGKLAVGPAQVDMTGSAPMLSSAEVTNGSTTLIASTLPVASACAISGNGT